MPVAADRDALERLVEIRRNSDGTVVLGVADSPVDLTPGEALALAEALVEAAGGGFVVDAVTAAAVKREHGSMPYGAGTTAPTSAPALLGFLTSLRARLESTSRRHEQIDLLNTRMTADLAAVRRVGEILRGDA